MDRRTFLGASAVAGSLALQAQAAPNDRITVAAIGIRGRGGSVLKAFASRPNVDVKYLIDVDQSVLDRRADEIQKMTGKRPKTGSDFRITLDDPAIDAIMLGTPTHWHAIPTIQACQAKKDVYVEKPDAHNIIEGQLMVAAAKRHGRVVQLGTQSRSGKHFQDAMQYISEGHSAKRYTSIWEASWASTST